MYVEHNIYSIVDIDIIWMRYAIVLSNFALLEGEITVGAVLVYNGDLIGYGYNSSIKCNDPTAHAEIIALRIGGKLLGNYRLLNTTLYVTLEPCIMCIGAIIHARIYRLVYGAKTNKISWIRFILLLQMINSRIINHYILIKTGVLEKECSMNINNFFKLRRKLQK